MYDKELLFKTFFAHDFMTAHVTCLKTPEHATAFYKISFRIKGVINMIPKMTHTMTLSALALVFALAVAHPAQAEDAAPAAAAEATTSDKAADNNPGGVKERMKETGGKDWHKKRGEKGEHDKKGPRGFGIPSAEELDKLEGMNAEQRKAYMEEKRKKWEGMTDEQKKAEMEKNRAAYDALSDEQKAALKERHKKLREKYHAEKKAEFDAMTPEEQEAFKKKMRARIEERGGKWGESMDGEGNFKKRGEFKKGDKPAETTPAAPAAE